MAAGLSVDLEGWRREFDELMLRVGGRFARVEPRRRMASFVRGLLVLAREPTDEERVSVRLASPSCIGTSLRHGFCALR